MFYNISLARSKLFYDPAEALRRLVQEVDPGKLVRRVDPSEHVGAADRDAGSSKDLHE